MHSVRHLELVRALAEHRNFSRAAAALRVSQPSLTRSLKLLEDMLGVTLFDRAGVTPTVFGEIVLKHSRPVLDGFAELRREIGLTKGLETGELSVSMGSYPADISGHEAVALLSERHPKLMLDTRMTDWSLAQDNVLKGAVELALADIREVEESVDFVCEPVRSSPLSFFCRADHPLAWQTAIDFEDLTNYPWAGPNIPAKLTAPMTPADRPCGVFDSASGRFRPRILVESFASAKHIVLCGNALSAALPFQIDAEREAGELILLPVALPFLTLSYGFIAKRNRAETPAARVFKDLVRSVERRRDGFAANETIPSRPR